MRVVRFFMFAIVGISELNSSTTFWLVLMVLGGMQTIEGMCTRVKMEHWA